MKRLSCVLLIVLALIVGCKAKDPKPQGEMPASQATTASVKSDEISVIKNGTTEGEGDNVRRGNVLLDTVWLNDLKSCRAVITVPEPDGVPLRISLGPSIDPRVCGRNPATLAPIVKGK